MAQLFLIDQDKGEKISTYSHINVVNVLQFVSVII